MFAFNGFDVKAVTLCYASAADSFGKHFWTKTGCNNVQVISIFQESLQSYCYFIFNCASSQTPIVVFVGLESVVDLRAGVTGSNPKLIDDCYGKRILYPLTDLIIC